MPDYDFYHGLYSGQQVDSAVARALAGGQLDQDIAAIRAAVGSPLVANTAAEMTNVNKIYVYTGSEAGYSTGHWYYYEGGEWNDGGLYNSAAADDAMSDSSTNAVQNKVIKEYVDTAIYAEQTRAEGVESLKAPLASPALTGTPTAPTAAAGTANTQIATTAYADNAVAVEKARAEAVEATKADQSFAEYILLREEEDRQILFGSIVEAAEDEYSELRSSPIHNAITIGQSVYPRMDRTRMAIDAIRGRTVAFNQLAILRDSWTEKGLTYTKSADGKTFTLTGTIDEEFPYGQIYLSKNITVRRDGRKYLILASAPIPDLGIAGYGRAVVRGAGYGFFTSTDGGTWDGNVIIQTFVNVGATYDYHDVSINVIDLTQMYGSALADQIYAMETAQAGAGVAYVRQRMDLDYYAANGGELKAPVVSGVGFVGKNLLDVTADSETVNGVTFTVNEDGTVLVNGTASARADIYCHAGGVKLELNQQYILTGCPSGGSDSNWALYLDADGSSADYGDGATFTYHGQVAVCRIRIASGTACNNLLFKPMIRFATIADASFAPYISTTLSLPSTRLDGVGDAQDVMYVREDGEDDYSLIKTAKILELDLGSVNWGYSDGVFYTTAVPNKARVNQGVLCAKYVNPYTTNTGIANMSDKTLQNRSDTDALYIKDSAYTDAATFKTAMSGVMIAYEAATPTETVIAEHLTLADISAIAENGGIISVENSNGHIVQPDCVMDTVISRSAS